MAGHADPAGQAGTGAALRREPPPDRRLLRRRATSGRPAGQLPPATGQGTVLQQHRRRRRRVGMRAQLRSARLRHRQARQPLRRGRRGQHAGCLPASLQDRPDVGLWRHHRLQPPGGRRHGRSRERAVPGSAAGSRLRRRGAGHPGRQEERARAGSADGHGPERLRHQARGRRLAGAEPGRLQRAARCAQGGLEAPAHRTGNERPGVCLEGRQVRQVQRHRVRGRRHDPGRGRRPDEPHRLCPHRLHQGGERRPDPAGLGRGLRRLLPVPRRPGRGGGGWRDLRDPARRQRA
ncbi:hypothetical protein D9M68_668890 [compost metagenome]